MKDSYGMGIKILIVTICSSSIMKVIYYFSLFELRYIFTQNISNLLLDKRSITLNVDINAYMTRFNTVLLKCLKV